MALLIPRVRARHWYVIFGTEVAVCGAVVFPVLTSARDQVEAIGAVTIGGLAAILAMVLDERDYWREIARVWQRQASGLDVREEIAEHLRRKPVALDED